jgi:potassium efflux system protein
MTRQTQRLAGLSLLLAIVFSGPLTGHLRSEQTVQWRAVRPASAEVDDSVPQSPAFQSAPAARLLVVPADTPAPRTLPPMTAESLPQSNSPAGPSAPGITANPIRRFAQPAPAAAWEPTTVRSPRVAPAQLATPLSPPSLFDEANPLRRSQPQPQPQPQPAELSADDATPASARKRSAESTPEDVTPPTALKMAGAESALPFPLAIPTTNAVPNESAVEAPVAAPTSPSATPPITVLDDEVSAENIAAAQQQIAQTEGLDETQRSELLGMLDQAAKWLATAGEYETKTSQYLTEIEAAPQELAQAPQLLETPLSDPKPEVAPDTTLAQLEQALNQAEEQANQAQGELEKLEEQLDSKTRADRLAGLAQLKEDVKKRLQEADDELKALASVEGAEEVATVRRIEALARKQAAEQQLQLVEAERKRHESLVELLPLQRDLAQRQCTWAEKHAAALAEVVVDFRKRESELQAAEARRMASEAHPALRDLAESNATLTEQRTRLAEQMDLVGGYKEYVGTTLTDLRDEYKDVAKKVKVHGMTPTVGILLQNRRDRLPDIGLHRQRIKFARQEMQQAQVASLVLEEDRSQMADFDVRIEQAIAEIGDVGKQFSPGYLDDMVRDLMEDRRTYLNSLLADNQTYQEDLNQLELDTRALLDEVAQYRAFIDEHVLWTPSTHVLSLRDVRDSGRALVSFSNAGTWSDVGGSLVQNVRQYPVHSGLLVVACIILFVFRRRMLMRLEWLGHRVADEQELSIVPTLQALVLTVLLAGLGPLMLWGAGWWLTLNADAPDLARALSNGFKAISLSYFVAEIFRQTCRPNGLADKHFGWPPECLPVLYRSLNWLMILALPILFVVSLFAMHDEGAWKYSLGRLAFLMGLGVLTLYLHYILRPKAGVLQAALARAPVGAVQRLRWVWYALGVGFPIALGVLIVLGYCYSADQLMGRVAFMVCLMLAILLAQAVAGRTLSVAWKRVSMLRAAGATGGNDPDDGETQEEGGGLSEEQAVERQLGQFVRWVAVLTFGVCAWLIWADVFPALQVLDRVELWPTNVVVKTEVELADGTKDIVRESKTVPITLSHMLIAVVALIATVAAAKTLPGLLEFALLARLPIDKGARNACVIISRYVVTLLGVIVACRMIGMTWSSVQWLAAAMTVGLGFGLQEIFANLVSGLIILFERPIRMGDLVTVNGTTGKVTRMQIRATTITDFDRRELIVPNKRFITDDVVNWTLSDPITRFVIPVGISYDNDPSQARDILLDVGRRHPLVLSEPAPSAVFVAFGDSTLNLELRAFIGSRDHYGTVLHEINVAIEKAFRKAGIEIAFPQQDLHIRSVNGLPAAAEPAPVTLRKAA